MLGSDDLAAVEIPLAPGFRYVHEPLDSDAAPIPLLGGPQFVAALKERLRYSSGGAFLLTGFRGVGKSTIVARALTDLLDEDEAKVFVPVTLSVARPMSTAALLFAVVRRTFETLQDRGLFDRLEHETQRALLLAYLRTSLSLSENRAEAVETTRSLSVSAPGSAGAGAAAAVLQTLLPKLDLARKRSSSMALGASFLAYSDTDVEHDFLRIVGLLQERHEPPRSRTARLLQAVGLRRREPAWCGRLIVVLDELDKLTGSEAGLAALEDLLVNLKNVLAVRGCHFIFVGGPDLHDRALADSQRGSGIFESVFSWQRYLPCHWELTAELLDRITADEPADQPADLEPLRDYLDFKARGVPRRLLQELYAFVVWRDERAALRLDPDDFQRVGFYAELQRVVRTHLDEDGALLPVPIDEDRRRLAAYYVTDWILRTAGAVFTVADVVDASGQVVVDPLIGVTARQVERLLAHLGEHDFVEVIDDDARERTIIGPLSEPAQARYRLSDDALERLTSFVTRSDRERAQLVTPRVVMPVAEDPAVGAPSPPAPPPAPHDLVPAPLAPPPRAASAKAVETPQAYTAAEGYKIARDFSPRALAGGRYRLGRLIGSGATGSVYEAEDTHLGRTAAVKVLESHALRGDPSARARFQREAEVLARLHHPGLVSIYELVDEPDGRMGIVMSLVQGRTLAAELRRRSFTVEEAVATGLWLAGTLAYLHETGVARLDLKPSNVMLTDAGPVIVDLGLAKQTIAPVDTTLTVEGAIVGTPAYMAPEQFGVGDVDIRSDLFALGLIMFEMIAGPNARPRLDSVVQEMLRTINEPVPIDTLAVSAELRAVLFRVTDRDPDRRFADPMSFREALLATPEAARSRVVAEEPAQA